MNTSIIRAIQLVVFSLSLIAAVQFGPETPPAHAAQPVSPGRVLILGPTVSPNNTEANQAALLGFAVDTVSSWAGITPTSGVPAVGSGCPANSCGFEHYRAIILGDPACTPQTPPPPIEAVETSTLGVWPLITGNVVIIGTDPAVHEAKGGTQMTYSGIKFATSDPQKTGAFVTLSCYYWNPSSGGGPLVTNEPILAGLGQFDVQGVAGCFNTAHKVAEHPALAGLTDAVMSNWNCSVHEAFFAWPTSFTPLAIAQGFGTYVASDSTPANPHIGQPYILARSPDLLPITPTNVTICKQTDPDGASQAFNFDLQSDVEAFVVPPLRDNECHTISADPGEYFVEELVGLLPPGWTIVNIECFYLGHPIGMPFFEGMTEMGFVLVSGANVTCTFTNRLINYIAVGGIAGISAAGTDFAQAADGGSMPTEPLALGAGSVLIGLVAGIVVLCRRRRWPRSP